MAKLFVTCESEKRQIHLIGNRDLEIKVYYGSKEDSKLLTHILVIAKNPDKPEFFQVSNIEPKPFTMRQ